MLLAKIIRWEPLPERQYKASSRKETQYELLEVCEEIKLIQHLHAEKWAVIRVCENPKDSHTLAWLLNARRIKLPDGDFKFAARETKKGEFAVYCRFDKKK